MSDAATGDEGEIRRIFDGWCDALRRKDPAGLMAYRAPDILSFDLAPPLFIRGPDLAGTQAWFATWDGPIDLEFHDLTVEIGGDVAFGTTLHRMRGTKTDGEQVDVWFRATFGCRKRDGRWQVVHEHASVPFYMDGSLKAAVDLKP